MTWKILTIVSRTLLAASLRSSWPAQQQIERLGVAAGTGQHRAELEQELRVLRVDLQTLAQRRLVSHDLRLLP